jgi:hypothetical protein
MKRKTVYRSAVARDKANLPIMYDMQSTKVFALAKWGPKLQELDSCAFGEDHVTPAFRTGGPDSPALDVDILREFMRTVAESTISDWEIHDYGCHSLRIGREAQLRMSGARADTITDITSHTSEQGRAAYTRQETADVLAANRGADEAVVHTVERLSMGADGAVLIAADGAAVTPAAQPAPAGAAAATGGATPGPKLRQSSLHKWAAVPTKTKKDGDL